MSKVAVVFWSATGNTETMANCVQRCKRHHRALQRDERRKAG